MTLKSSFILFLFLVIVFQKTLGQNSKAFNIYIGEKSQIQEVDKSYNLKKVKSAKNWQSHTEKAFKIENRHNALWVRFIIDKSQTGCEYLTALTPNVDIIELYVNDLFQGRSGDHIVHNNRKITNAYPTIELPKLQVDDTLLIKLQMEEDFIIPVVLENNQSFQNANGKRKFSTGMYLGVMLSIFLYNLFLYISIRNKLLIYYSLYILFVCLTQLSIFSNISEIIYPNNLFWLRRDVFIFSSALGVAMGPFLLHFLNLKVNSKIYYYTILSIVSCYPFALLLSFTGFLVITMKYLIFLNFIGSVALLLIATLLFHIETMAKFFLLAWTTFLVGVIIFILQNIGIIPYNVAWNYSMTFGTAIEAVLLSFALGYHFNRLIKENKTKDELLLEQVKIIGGLNLKVKKSELSLLKDQMDPHFLFNAMTSIQSYIVNEDNERAAQFISRYAKMMRLSLNHTENGCLSLDEEVSFLTNYIEMEVLRLGISLDYNINIKSEDDIEDIVIPPLMIQPIVENSMKHAFANDSTNATLNVNFKIKDDIIYVSVKDNGVGINLNLKKIHQSKGLRILNRRLNLLNDTRNKDYIEIQSIPDLGTEVRIELPVSSQDYD